MANNSSLISVIVVTYNSACTIIETLDSIKDQTYDNIELIISDDCSQDNTVDVCQEWINTNKQRFEDVFLVKTDKNRGIPANCNRGIKASHGEWIRIIAGDDLLPEDALTNQIGFIGKDNTIRIINGYCVQFKIENGTRIELPTLKTNDRNPNFYKSTAEEQYHYLLHHYNFGLTDGTLVHRSVYQDISMYDEKYPMIEDLPFWLTITKAGIKYHYVDTPTLLYRIHESVVHISGDQIASKKFWDARKQIVKEKIQPYVSFYELGFYKKVLLDNLKYWFIFSVFKNKRSFISKLVLAILYRV